MTCEKMADLWGDGGPVGGTVVLKEACVQGAHLKGIVTVAFPYYSLLFLGYHDIRSLHHILLQC